MTLRLNSNNSQANLIKQLKAAQSRVTESNKEHHRARELNNESTKDVIDPTSYSASYSKGSEQISNQNKHHLNEKERRARQEKKKKTEEKIAQSDKKAKKASYEVKSLKEKLNVAHAEDLNKNKNVPESLPKKLKERSDIEAITKSVDTKEAISNPDKAVQGLVDQALMGNKKAFMKLNEYSKNQFDKLQDSAGKGMEKVASGAEGKPKVLEMIASSATDKANEAAAKLMHLSNKNPRAQQGFDRLLKNNAINFTKVANEAKNMDPANTASSINNLMNRGMLSKADKKGAIGILGEIAKESPTGAGSKEAAKGLTKAVMREPMDIAKKAAVELKEATLNGNDSALNGLQAIAKANDPSKAQLGLIQLGEIAKTGASSSAESLGTIKEVAQDPTSNGKSKNMAVSILSNLSNTSGTNSKEALNTLSSIATNKNNPASSFAFNEIGKVNDSKISNNFKTTNPGKQNALSNSDTYKKVMALQTQMNSLTQNSNNFLNFFGSKLLQS